MYSENSIIPRCLMDEIVYLAITDTEFLAKIRRDLEPSLLSCEIAEQVLRICYAYFDRNTKAPDEHFADELGRFLRDKSDVGKDEYSTYVLRVLEMDEPNRSFAAARIDYCIRTYSHQQEGTERSVKSTLKNGKATENVLASSEFRPHLVNLGDVQAKEIQWLWPNRIPLAKLTIIAGEPGIGKSFFTLDLAARVSTGRTWPDVDCDAPKGSVVILSSEDGLADTIKPRLQSAGADSNKITAIKGVVSSDGKRRWFSLKKHIPVLEQALTDDTKLIIVDPVSAYLAGAGLSTNTQTRALLDPIINVGERYNVAIILVTHLNKNARASSLHRVIDSIGQVAAARSVWIVYEDKCYKGRKLFLPTKSNLLCEPTGLAFRIVNGVVEYEPEPIRNPHECLLDGTARSTPQLDRAMEFLSDALADGPVKSTEILCLAKEIAIAEDTLRRAKDELDVNVYKVGNDENACWYWALPEENED